MQVRVLTPTLQGSASQGSVCTPLNVIANYFEIALENPLDDSTRATLSRDCKGADTPHCQSLRHPGRASRNIPNTRAARYSEVHRFRSYWIVQFSALCARRSPTNTASSLEPCSQRISIYFGGRYYHPFEGGNRNREGLRCSDISRRQQNRYVRKGS